MKAALIIGGVVVVGGLGYFIYSAHAKAAAAASAAKQASSGSTGAAKVAHDILNVAPSAIALGQKIANIWG